MAGKISSWWRARLERWMAARVPLRDEITLNRRIIYILPSRNGVMFLLATGLIFIGAINYAVSLAFGLAFLMVSLFILAILHTFNNLNHLQLTAQPALPVYCGEDAGFNVLLARPGERRHEALELSFPEGVVSYASLLDIDREEVRVFTRARRRGLFPAPLLRVATTFPLGLVRAWSLVRLNMQCLVYPRPVPFNLQQFSGGGGGGDESSLIVAGSEDFYGLRDYVPGDPLRQVAWKNFARGQGMQLKQFVDYADERTWLDWDMFYGFGVEDRLSRLCYCVLHLTRSGKAFGLKLPGIEIAPAAGVEHRNRVLRVLALYGREEG
ncbi:MAG: DUF58 domain-containing protein [Pseudohongiellaceae bacterium]